VADEKKDAPTASAGSALASKLPKIPLLISIANLVVVAGAAALLFYVKMIYKRPMITEDTERARLAAARSSPVPSTETGYVNWEPTTVNIESVPAAPKAADGTGPQLQGKLHYATVGISFELRDIGKKDLLEELQPVIMDKFLGILGRKSFQELITVQGRYLIRSQVLDYVNQLAEKQAGPRDPAAASLKDGLITNVFFTQFIVQ
jgi:flagellar basal body-associated protein FliL